MDDAARARAAANKAAAMLKLAATKKRRSEGAAAAAAAAPAPAAKRAKPETAAADPPGCEVCGRGPPDATLERVFAVRVCAAHRREDTAYDLVGATDAAATYLLPKATLATLPSHERANPRAAGWKPMRLYLRRHLEAHADRRWGDAAGLDAERRRRDAAKVARADRAAAGFFKRA